MSVKGVGRDAVIYGFGVIMQRVASFLLLPIYTRLLTPADYGLLELLELTVEVVTILVSAGTMAGVQRFYYKRKNDQERKELITSAIVLLGALNAIGAVLIVLFAQPIHRFALAGEGEVWFLYITAARMLFTTATIAPFVYLQTIRKPKQYVTASLSLLVLKLALNILFVVVLRMGVLGVLISGLSSSVLAGSVMTVWVLRQTGLRVSAHAMKDLRRFGVPFQLAQAGGFILTFGDRFFLQSLQSMSVVGIYSLAYKFGFLVPSLCAGPLFNAWSPYRHELASEPRAVRDAEYNRGFKFTNLILIPATVAIATGVRPFLRVMSDPEFLPAAAIAPIIVLAYVIDSWTWVVRFGISVSERTAYHTAAVWSSVFVILVAYATLIPPYGLLGAAFATLIGFLVKFGMTYLFAQRVWPVSYVWRPHVTLLCIAIAIVLLYLKIPATTAWLVDAAAAAVAPVVTLIAGFFVLLSREERALTVGVVRGRVGQLRSARSDAGGDSG